MGRRAGEWALFQLFQYVIKRAEPLDIECRSSLIVLANPCLASRNL